jgi:hypothetical protein
MEETMYVLGKREFETHICIPGWLRIATSVLLMLIAAFIGTILVGIGGAARLPELGGRRRRRGRLAATRGRSGAGVRHRVARAGIVVVGSVVSPGCLRSGFVPAGVREHPESRQAIKAQFAAPAGVARLVGYAFSSASRPARAAGRT